MPFASARNLTTSQRVRLSAALLVAAGLAGSALLFWLQETRHSASSEACDLSAARDRIVASLLANRCAVLETRTSADAKTAQERRLSAEQKFQNEIDGFRSTFRRRLELVTAAEQLRDFVTGPLHAHNARHLEASAAALESTAYDADQETALKNEQDRLVQRFADELEKARGNAQIRSKSAEAGLLAVCGLILALVGAGSVIGIGAAREAQASEEAQSEALSTLKEIRSIAENRRESIARLRRQLDLLKAPQASQALSAVHEHASRIGLAAGTLSKVADQSNLLSLNAAIEAEKAGEYGLGFAVVAMEIRRLSDQTLEATAEIEKVLRELQGCVNSGISGSQQQLENARGWQVEGEQLGADLQAILSRIAKLDASLKIPVPADRALQRPGATL